MVRRVALIWCSRRDRPAEAVTADVCNNCDLAINTQKLMMLMLPLLSMKPERSSSPRPPSMVPRFRKVDNNEPRSTSSPWPNWTASRCPKSEEVVSFTVSSPKPVSIATCQYWA